MLPKSNSARDDFISGSLVCLMLMDDFYDMWEAHSIEMIGSEPCIVRTYKQL